MKSITIRSCLNIDLFANLGQLNEIKLVNKVAIKTQDNTVLVCGEIADYRLDD